MQNNNDNKLYSNILSFVHFNLPEVLPFMVIKIADGEHSATRVFATNNGISWNQKNRIENPEPQEILLISNLGFGFRIIP